MDNPMENRGSLNTFLSFDHNENTAERASTSEKQSEEITVVKSESKIETKPKAPSKRAKGECFSPATSSGTQFFMKESHTAEFVRVSSNQFFGHSETISGSTPTYKCDHGSEGRQYTEKGLRKRNFVKELDPRPVDKKWLEECPPAYGWDMARTLAFIVTDPVGVTQIDRQQAHLKDFAKTSSKGYRVDVLEDLCTILDYLVESLYQLPELKGDLEMLLKNMKNPILLNLASDVITYIDMISFFIGYLGYLLMRVEDDDLFTLVSNAILWQLSAGDRLRGPGTAHHRHVMAAAAPVLRQSTARMISVANGHRFPTFLQIALLLACDSVDNCIELMKENIIENIFYRFNPYFPERKLPFYDINPADLQDYNVKLGDSSVNISTALSLLLVLVKTTKEYLEEHPHCRRFLPCPDKYSQRCFIWAYRYECRAREHHHERTSLTVLVAVLLDIFGERLTDLSSLLMPDILSLSVLSELPPRADWVGTVNFNTAQRDVQFKKTLITLGVKFFKLFPSDKYLIESRYWLLGLMYLIDPGLCYLRAKWSPALFAELRKISLQALVSVLPLTSPTLAVKYGLTRRIMWYIEWYSENTFELPVLYWCIRLLQVVVENRQASDQRSCLRDLFDTHGIIIIMHLCYTLLNQKKPPVEKSQIIISLCLRILTNAVEVNKKVACCVYPYLKWPQSVNSFVTKMLDIIITSLDMHFIISNRWLVSLMNFIWEAIIWKAEYRAIFIAENGIYKLLDIVAMTKPSVQCIALALLCDVARAGEAVGQLVTWRANLGATRASPNVVKRGATIASLLAEIFRDECKKTGVPLEESGIIQDLNYPLMAAVVRKAMQDPDFRKGKHQRTSVCYAAADLAGSRMSKVFALLHMLSDDLAFPVSLADEAYNLYSNIKLTPEDETILVLCSHYLTIKFNEVWLECELQCPDLQRQDHEVMEEFLHIGKGWAKEIKQQQEDVFEKGKQAERDEENSLYAFLARVRLNIALDALREVRCIARASDRNKMQIAMIHEAVSAHHRRSIYSKRLDAPILKTYGYPLDDQNVTGQNVKVLSIYPKDKPKPREVTST